MGCGVGEVEEVCGRVSENKAEFNAETQRSRPDRVGVNDGAERKEGWRDKLAATEANRRGRAEARPYRGGTASGREKSR